MIDIPNIFPDLKHVVQELQGGRLRLAQDVQDQLHKFGLDPSVIVDLGCGPMTTTELLARGYPNARVIGCDIKDHKSSVIGRPNLDFSLIEPFSLFKKISKADLILLVGVIHHVKPGEEDLLLRDVYSSLSDGGILVVHEHILSTNLIRRKLERFLLSCVEFGINRATEDMSCSYNFFMKDILIDALKRNGFKIVEAVDVGGRYTTLPFLNDHTLFYCKKGARSE
jgi:SAM-dependent methyltransferase